MKRIELWAGDDLDSAVKLDDIRDFYSNCTTAVDDFNITNTRAKAYYGGDKRILGVNVYSSRSMAEFLKVFEKTRYIITHDMVYSVPIRGNTVYLIHQVSDIRMERDDNIIKLEFTLENTSVYGGKWVSNDSVVVPESKYINYRVVKRLI